MNTYLIYIAPGIGDFIIAMPLIQSIKSQDPTAVIDCLHVVIKDV